MHQLVFEVLQGVLDCFSCHASRPVVLWRCTHQSNLRYFLCFMHLPGHPHRGLFLHTFEFSVGVVGSLCKGQPIWYLHSGACIHDSCQRRRSFGKPRPMHLKVLGIAFCRFPHSFLFSFCVSPSSTSMVHDLLEHPKSASDAGNVTTRADNVFHTLASTLSWASLWRKEIRAES